MFAAELILWLFVERKAETADHAQTGVTAASQTITTRVMHWQFLIDRLPTFGLQLIGGSVQKQVRRDRML